MRTLIAVTLALTVAACGFRPAGTADAPDATGGEAEAVRISPIAERSGQLVRRELVRRLNAGASGRAAYVLDVTLEETVAQTGFRQDQTETRRRVRLDAAYTLRRVTSGDDGEPVLQADTQLTTNVNVLDQPYATRQLTRDARQRGARALARRIARDVRSKLGG